MKTHTAVTRRQFFEVLAAAGGSMALAGCGSTSSSDSGGSDSGSAGTLTIGIQDEPEGLDIQQITWENYVHWLIYEPIIVYSDDLSEVKPSFAKEFTVSDDGLTITVVLPEDAKFSNGDALDANSYKASLDRYLEVSPYASDYDDVESFEVTDDTTLVMHMKSPAPYIMTPLSTTYAGIVDTEVADSEDNDEFNRNPVAQGPYYVEEWEQGSQVTLKKNENYQTNNPYVDNGGPLAFDEIVVRFISDEFTRVSEVESGSVDIIFDVPTSSYQELKDNSDIEVYDYKQSGVSFMYFQTDSGPLADEKVRQAVAYALDRDELQDALDDLVTPMYGYISDAQSCYSEDEESKLADQLAYDADKAASLLAEAGYEDSDGDGIVEKDGEKLTLEMLVPNDRASLSNAAPVIQKQLQAVGIDATITEQESAYIRTAMEDNDIEIAMRNFVWLDPDILYSVFTPASGYPWDDAEVTDALTTARQTSDSDERIAAYEDAQDILATKFKACSLFADLYAIAAKSTVSGVHVTNDGRMFLNDASV
jgi:peptide/nickel transport system substrate-binding protein